MHYALAILDKQNGTASDIGSVYAGENRWSLLHTIADNRLAMVESLVNGGAGVDTVHSGINRAVLTIGESTRGENQPGCFTAQVVPGYRLEVRRHDGAGMDCEGC